MTSMSIKFATAGALALGSALFAVAPASAAPMLDPGVATTADVAAAKPEAVRWVCGPYRCFWRPGPRFYGPGPGFYGPRRFYGGGPRFYGGGYGRGFGGRGFHGGYHRF